MPLPVQTSSSEALDEATETRPISDWSDAMRSDAEARSETKESSMTA